MTLDLLTALILFALATSATPGPNNLMLMASGANYGFTRSIPHMLGISIGFGLMIVLVGAGLTQIFDSYPVSHTVLKLLSVLYLSYLAWRIATAAPIDSKTAEGRPMTFLQAAAFQWVNPKAWAMALTALSVYAPSQTLAAFVVVATVFATVNLPAITAWTVLGQQFARILTNPRRLALFNWSMAALLIASLYPVLWPA
ncbi:amino acid transporter LysE [Roseobacter cerasinus]|uniref:Amino acid transporter LysE n=1 Tax=Roseobacter cerasinus TaxID=2602289 RepID=A0A640VR88_9RHOB|nr:LysE family translocator [Roseobacter cerasinus]GFE50539.1 amino acid transporter LysE [Roseobacter cerasinus]